MSEAMGAAAVGAGGDLLSTAFSLINQQWATAGTKQMQKRSIVANAQSQKYAAELARYLRQHAYQDTMADMKAAGLNPMLAFSQGASGGAPVGSAGAPSGSADSSARMPAMGQSINSALAAPLARQQIQANTQATIEAAGQAREQAGFLATQNRLAPGLAAARMSADLAAAQNSTASAAHQDAQARNAREGGAGTHIFDPRVWRQLIERAFPISSADEVRRSTTMPGARSTARSGGPMQGTRQHLPGTSGDGRVSIIPPAY